MELQIKSFEKRGVNKVNKCIANITITLRIEKYLHFYRWGGRKNRKYIGSFLKILIKEFIDYILWEYF